MQGSHQKRILKIKLCPICNRKLYPKAGGGFYCKNCPFVNDPNYLNKNEKNEK